MNDKLGQIFTRQKVAKYMVDLLDCHEDSKILAPCFGVGVFLDCLCQKGYRNLTGNFSDLPKTSNLYMFFIMKAIHLMKENGTIVVIFPESWMKARVGKKFLECVNRSCAIEKNILVKGNAFERWGHITCYGRMAPQQPAYTINIYCGCSGQKP